MTAVDATVPVVPPALTAQDTAALACLAAGNDWTRAALCTLARRGVHIRRTEPDRARALTEALARWPWYKAGQFLFDLLEWEDFMTDGPPPPLLPLTRTAAILDMPLRLLRGSLTAPFMDGSSGPGTEHTVSAVYLPLRWLGSIAQSAAAGVLTDLRNATGQAAPASEGAGSGRPAETAGARELPPLEPGFHLYRDVALGFLDVAGPLLAAHAPSRPVQEGDED